MLRTMHFVIEKVKGRKWTKTQKKEREKCWLSVCVLSQLQSPIPIFMHAFLIGEGNVVL